MFKMGKTDFPHNFKSEFKFDFKCLWYKKNFKFDHVTYFLLIFPLQLTHLLKKNHNFV